jgi:hypothetical protein
MKGGRNRGMKEEREEGRKGQREEGRKEGRKVGCASQKYPNNKHYLFIFYSLTIENVL